MCLLHMHDVNRQSERLTDSTEDTAQEGDQQIENDTAVCILLASIHVAMIDFLGTEGLQTNLSALSGTTALEGEPHVARFS